MRKLIVGLIAAAVASFGMVSLSEAPAQAITCPYTGCVRTSTDISAPGQIVRGGILPIRVKVSARSGSANPRGTLSASCSRPGKTKSKQVGYRGNPRTVFFTLRKKATWTCTVRFSSARKFRASSDSTTVRVVRR